MGGGLIVREYVPTIYQEAFLQSRARYPAFVAGWGTGKTMYAILKGLNLSQEYSNNLGLIVRKNFTDLRDSTIKDFTRYTGLPVPTNKDVVLPNNSQIMFRHMDELAGIIQNVNLGWFFIEQAEEFDNETEFENLGGRLRREGCFRQGFVIANTKGHNWIWRYWKRGDLTGVPYKMPSGIKGIDYTALGELVEASSLEDTNYLPPDTIADWKQKEIRAPATYRRCVLNSWEDVDIADQCIPYEMVYSAINKKLINFGPSKRLVACDPAEFGDDHTVIYVLEDGRPIHKEKFGKKEPMSTAGMIMKCVRDFKAAMVGIDDIGIGAGIRSRLCEIGCPNVMGINSGSKSSDPERWKNLKAEMWMNAQEMFRDELVSLPEKDDALIEQLPSVRYSTNSKGQVQIERKDETKKRLGCSPDEADAFVIGLYLLKMCEATVYTDEEMDEQTSLAESYSVKSNFC